MHLPGIREIIGIYGKKNNLHKKYIFFSLALQPEALLNTSGRVLFSSPGLAPVLQSRPLFFSLGLYCQQMQATDMEIYENVWLVSYFNFLPTTS